ncbi:MAG: hypothetical protein Ct9H300mP8_05740 [Gammaproteobacteria bacterium]|nr:MAG: hypothetical protein Ct9H300mP8_05740 [Gammaproteobacteria bacterium]
MIAKADPDGSYETRVVPVNQVSAASLVAPVLPDKSVLAVGELHPRVSRAITSRSIELIIKTLRSSITRGALSERERLSDSQGPHTLGYLGSKMTEPSRVSMRFMT